MASNLFGITAAGVRSHHFAQQDAFSSTGQPTVATITEAISEEAAVMAGKLALELIDAESIEDDSDAYKACARILRMQCAVRIALDMLRMDSELVRSWQATVAAWYADLEVGGAPFLGDGATTTGDEEPDGPTWHGTELEQDSTDDMSSTIPLLRKGDRL
jgi:hypothetical protein